MTGFLVNIGISFLLTPYIVNHIGTEAYGFVGLANNFVSYAQIITIALNSMASRFIAIKIHQNNIEDSNRYFASVVYANIITAAFLTIPAFLVILNLPQIVNISPRITADVQLLWAFLFFNFLISIITATYSLATFVRNKLYLDSLQAIVSSFIRVLILVVLFNLFMPSVWYLGLASTVSLIYYIISSMRYTRLLLPEIKVERRHFDFEVIKVLLSSGIWNSLTRLSKVFSNGLDLLITNLYVDPTAMGLLSLSKTIPLAIMTFFGALAHVFTPELTASYAKDDFQGMREQLLTSIKFLGTVSVIPVAALFAFGDDFYRLWVPGENAHLLHTLTMISCVEYVFSLPLEGLWNIFAITNKVKHTALYMFVNSFLTIGIVLIGVSVTESATIKLFIIAGTSTFFSIISSLLFLPIFGARYLNLDWKTFYPAIFKNSLSVVVVSLFALALDWGLNLDSWLSLFLAGGMVSVFSLSLSFFVILDKKERNFVMRRFSRDDSM